MGSGIGDPLRRHGRADLVRRVGRAGWCAPRERRFHGRRETFELRLLALRLVLVELGHHLSGEELQRLADVLVLVATGLADEDHLVDTGLFVPAHERAELLRRADRAAQRAEAALEHLRAEGLAGLRRDGAVEAE